MIHFIFKFHFYYSMKTITVISYNGCNLLDLFDNIRSRTFVPIDTFSTVPLC